MMASVDWSVALSTGTALVKVGPVPPLGEAISLVRDLRQAAGIAASHVYDATGVAPFLPTSDVRIVDRRDWIRLNVESLEHSINPLLPQSSQSAKGLGAKAAGVQAGGLLAYVAGRVLGQYDFLGSETAENGGNQGTLLLVAPNIFRYEKLLAVPPRDFRMWVCLHEATHQAQFAAAPWMRPHILENLKTFLDADNTESVPIAARLRAMVQTVGSRRAKDTNGSLLDAMVNNEQRHVVDHLSNMMTLLEGHADYVMDLVGERIIPSVKLLRRRFEDRRQSTNPFAAVFQRLLGVEAKLQQYVEGRRFVLHVIQAVGPENFNVIWQRADNIPSRGEIASPQQWLTRMGL